MNDLGIYQYYISVYLESVLFCDDVVLRVQNDIEQLTNPEVLFILLDLLNELEYTKKYPKEIVDNIGKLIELLKNNTTHELLNKIELKYNEIKDYEYSDEVYYEEAMLKVFNINSAMDESYNKEVLRNSIIFDYYTFTSLLDDNIKIDQNYFYILSIKKFLLTYPDMFKDKDIRRRAFNILNKNKYEETDHLIYKIKHINKHQNTFNYGEFKALVYYLIVESMVYDREYIKEKEELINYQTIRQLYQIIDDNLISNESVKNNMYVILFKFKELYIDNLDKENKKELLNEYNNYIGKLNSNNEYDFDLKKSEHKLRYDILDKLENIEYDISSLLNQDLNYLNYLTTSTEIENTDKIYLSINKCIALAPSLFDDPDVYNRTMTLLNKNTIHNNITKRKVNKLYRG